MEGFALLSLMLIATHVGGSELTQARGGWSDEGGWSPPMSQQPEILLVKEKGGSSSSASSSMKMKDLTPLICLLAPLLLAAIMLPAKMTMMMNSMMASNTMPMIPTGMLPNGMLPGINGMLPGINGMLPGGMLPGGMLPGGMIPLLPFSLPLTSLLTNGMGNSNSQNSLGLPIFKNIFESKKFSDGEHQQADNDTNTKDVFSSNQDLEVAEDSKKNKTSDWYTINADKSSSSVKSKLKKTSKINNIYKGDKGDNIKHEWASRVWSTQPSGITLAEEILKLFDEVSDLI